MAKLSHIIRRCREEGPRNSFRFAVRRLQAPLKKAYLRRKYTRGKIYNKTAGKGLHLRYGVRGQFFFAAEDLPAMATWFSEHCPEETIALKQRANQIVNHQFQWLCPNCPDFGSKIEWTKNFPDQRPWPMTFYSDLDYSSDARLGDIRELWELNRHQYFATLGKAYVLTGDSLYAEAFLAQLIDWIEHNPPGYGINWLHAQEVALRGVAWCWAYAFFCHYPGFSGQSRNLFFHALRAHADFVRWHLSDKPVTHNHLISEACGLALIGILFPNLPGASTWRRKGLKIFQREVLKQVWEDGLDGELSTNYHCFVLDSFLQLTILMQANGYAVPKKVVDRIEKMVEAVMHFLRPDGTLPLVGDNDSGRAFRLAELPPDDRRSLLATGAVMFGRSDFKMAAGGFQEETFWLLGLDGWRRFAALPEQEPEENGRCFQAGGLCVSRSSWWQDADFLLFRGGATQYRKGVSTSHNHADLLSFELFLRGRRVLIDPGVYLYGRDDHWRFHFRKTKAHSTLVIDGEDQFNVSATRFGIPFLPLSKFYKCDNDTAYAYFDMAQTGYAGKGIGHRRRIFWKKGWHLLILDELTGSEHHQIDLNFQFSPEVMVAPDRSGFSVSDQAGALLCTLKPCTIVLGDGQVSEKTQKADVGWIAERYGDLQKAPLITWSAGLDLPHRLLTVIDTRPSAALVIDLVEEGEGIMNLRLGRPCTFEQHRIDATGWWTLPTDGEGNKL